MGLPSVGKTLFGLPDMSLANYVMKKNQPKPPEMPEFPEYPKTPTIDDAARREEFTRKGARRKGRARNIFTRASQTASPSVATKTLLA